MNHNTILHEIQGSPKHLPDTKVTEAFGFRKSPKLVEQVLSLDENVRNLALKALADELLNQQVLAECLREKVMRPLLSFLSNDDSSCRLLASKALSVACRATLGTEAALDEDCIPELLLCIRGSTKEVKKNIFDVLYYISGSQSGVEACVLRQEVVEVLIQSIDKETMSKYEILLTLNNIVSGHHEGLLQALQADAIEVLMRQYRDNTNNIQIRTASIKLLGFICFNDKGREITSKLNAVPTCIEIISQIQDTLLISSTLIALMALTIDDAGKIQVYTCLPDGQAVRSLLSFIYNDNKAIRLNTMKLISNIAVYPHTRAIILTDERCVKQLREYSADTSDAMISKHAKVALDIVYWQP